MWDRRAEYVENYDGDTVRVVLDQGFGDTKQMDVRLLGVFAPELRQPGGVECREFTRAWFARQPATRWSFVVTTSRMKVADREQKTLDRYVGSITSLDGTDSLNMAVMAFIVANGYGGGVGV